MVVGKIRNIVPIMGMMGMGGLLLKFLKGGLSKYPTQKVWL